MDRLAETTGLGLSRDPTSLEDAVSAFVDALEHEREGLWEASWAVSRAVEACGISQRDCVAQIGSYAFSADRPKDAKRRLFGTFAEAGACSIARVAQLCAVGAAFPEPAVVAQDKSHTWHRKVAQRAKALGLDVLELQANALREGWGQRELDRLGKSDAARSVRFRGTCPDCAASVQVTMMVGMVGHPVRCPICSDERIIGALG
jgi:hypothetical protein